MSRRFQLLACTFLTAAMAALFWTGEARAQPRPPGDDASALSVTATGAPVARTEAARAADVFNVKDYGAVGDGVADDCLAINAAINAANARPLGGEVRLPTGTYRVDRAVCYVVIKSNITLRGAGRGKTIILIDDSRAHGDGITNGSGGNSFPRLVNFHMRDLTVSGMRASIASQGSQIFRIANGTDISVVDCEFTQSRFMGLGIGNSDQVVVRGNRIFHVNRDGISIWGSSNVIIDGNEIIGANDDAISAHVSDGDASPARDGLVITNNIITESQGITAGGPKNILIANNVMRRIMGYGIGIESDPAGSQAHSNMFSVKIINNIIHDVFLRAEHPSLNQAQAYIYAGGGARGSGTAASPPGTPAAGSGVVAPLYGSDGPGVFYANGTEQAPPPNPGGYWVEITGNQLVRSLPAVQAYGQWGYGHELFVGSGGDNGSYAGPIPEANLQIIGIQLDPAFKNARIADNIIQTTGKYGILFNPRVPWRDLDADGLVIERNQIADFSVAGIEGPANSTQRVVLRDNILDGDPRFAAPDRAPHGGWRPAATQPIGVALGASGGFVITGNSFRNLLDPVRQGARPNVLLNNLVYAQPFALGFSDRNLGVGVIAPASASWRYVIEESDPASPGYGRMIGPTVFAASAQPSAGSYVSGQFVANSGPPAAGTPLVTGWLRLTVGNAHVPGVDWAPIYAGSTVAALNEAAALGPGTLGIASGATVDLTAGGYRLISSNGGRIAAATMRLPASAGLAEGRVVKTAFIGDIGALTWVSADHKPILGAPHRIDASNGGVVVTLMWSGFVNAWVPWS